jgi:hypothetical protein
MIFTLGVASAFVFRRSRALTYDVLVVAPG